MSIFSQHSRSSRQGPACRQAGFTLIELLVVMSIMVIVTAFLLTRQAKFNSSTLLRSLAFSVALSVRQAQVYGTSVLGTTTATCIGGTLNSGICYSKSFGIYVSCANVSTCGATSYILFADLDNDGQWSASETVKTFTLGNGYIISDFGATNSLGAPRSFKFSALTSLTIIFTRPDPDASFSVLPVILGDIYSTAFIQVLSTGGDASATPAPTRRINMSSTGQISVGAAGT